MNHTTMNQQDKNLQLKMFENDVMKMFDWIKNNRDLFMLHYTKLGTSLIESKELLEQHNFFGSGSMNVYVNIKRLEQAAKNLIVAGHYASETIQTLYSKLERCWQEFASSIEQRGNLLKLAITFYENAEHYAQNTNLWTEKCQLNSTSIPNDVSELEEMVHQHQTLNDQIHEVYNKMTKSSKEVLNELESFICKHKSNSSSASLNNNYKKEYQEASKSIVNLTNDLSVKQLQIESIWQLKKVKLHQRLALALFEEDVKQVIEWIDVHGEGFLRKNIGVGKNLSRAQTLQKNHEHFESVAQNTYTNAEKLLAAADEFAQTGECNAQEIYLVAKGLEQHINKFLKKVERRRYVLQLGVLFYTHSQDLTNWFDTIKNQQEAVFYIPSSIEKCENLLKQVKCDMNYMVEASQDTLNEGETLIEELNKQKASLERANSADENNTSLNNLSNSIVAVQACLDKVKSIHNELKELWNTKKLKADLALQFRLFEKDSFNSCKKFEIYGERLRDKFITNDVAAAENHLRSHNENYSRIQQTAIEIIQRGKELNKIIDSCSFVVLIENDDNGPNANGVDTVDGTPQQSNGSQTASQRMKTILNYMQEEELKFEELCELNRTHLEQTAQFNQFESDAKQVLNWMRNGESMLAASFIIPTSLREAEDLQIEHEQFQLAIEVCVKLIDCLRTWLIILEL